MIERLKKNLPMVGVVIAFLVGAAFGSGAFWQWQQHVLDKVMKTTDLRKQENDLYSKFIEISEECEKYQELYNILDAKTTPTNAESNTKGEASLNMFRLNSQLDVMKDDLRVLEAKLSQLEGREPRKITLEFPQPVSKINIVHVQ
jgi:hypothetical protein